MSREGKCEAEGLAGRLLGAGCTDRSPWVPTQAVALLPCPDQHSPDWQLGPNRLGSWHSWQAEPPKFSWQRFTLSQCGPSPARPPHRTGPLPGTRRSRSRLCHPGRSHGRYTGSQHPRGTLWIPPPELSCALKNSHFTP